MRIVKILSVIFLCCFLFCSCQNSKVDERAKTETAIRKAEKILKQWPLKKVLPKPFGIMLIQCGDQTAG
jgi:hypothetical protein